MEPNDFALAGRTALEARDRLSALAASSAASDTPERKMAAIGQAALFEEALLSALRAHLAEFKLVTR